VEKRWRRGDKNGGERCFRVSGFIRRRIFDPSKETWVNPSHLIVTKLFSLILFKKKLFSLIIKYIKSKGEI